MPRKTTGNLSSLDSVFGAFVEQSIEDYISDSGLKINAVAILENKADELAPFTALPIYEPFVTNDGGQASINRESVGSISSMAFNTNKDALMFMVAFDGSSGSKRHGVKETLMVAAKRNDGALKTKVFLKDVPGHEDGVLTENVSHESRDWVLLKKPNSVEDKAVTLILDAIWKEYLVGMNMGRVFYGAARISKQK